MTDRLKITIPEQALTLVLGEETRTFGFKDLVLWALNSDTRFNQDGPGIKSSIRIELALEKAETEVTLKAEDHSRLAEALGSPSSIGGGRGYPISPARKLAPFIDAVEHATPVEE